MKARQQFDNPTEDEKITATNMGLWQVGRTEVIEH